MKHYCYVYYDENYQPYYVGKGLLHRIFAPRKNIIVPELAHIQFFEFTEEWKAYECEMELIAFWGRTIDGGTLLNKALAGGSLPTGLVGKRKKRGPLPQATKDKISRANKGKRRTPDQRRRLSDRMRGKKVSEQQRSVLSSANKKFWNSKTNQQRFDIAARNHGKPIIMTNSLTNETRTFNSGNAAARTLGIPSSSVAALRNGKISQTHGWVITNEAA